MKRKILLKVVSYSQLINKDALISDIIVYSEWNLK